MIILYLLIAICSFLFGFLWGAFKSKPKSKAKRVLADDELLRLQREYENFLNYDGTVQE